MDSKNISFEQKMFDTIKQLCLTVINTKNK